eukprot:TRINITY_DN24754_c0_g1_i1.p1 TRINITY_DN24754_c0_g1~~TRINITY_DN24754_c0_g1_i1.p1  ORF type:complete len:199 (-),score=29.62 TRINITY_DN24754_c0_g1_i1:111-626(-)
MDYWEYYDKYPEEYYTEYDDNVYQEDVNHSHFSSCFCQITILLVAVILVFILRQEGFLNWMNEKDYSFVKNSLNKYHRTTKKSGIDYYVNKNFNEKYSKASLLEKVEKEIEYEYLETLWSQCREVKDIKGKLEREQYYAQGTDKKVIQQELLQLNMSACEMYPMIKRRVQN